MNKDILDKLEIIEVVKNNKKLEYSKLEFKYFNHKYSNFSGNTINLFLDNNYISNKDTYIKYKCSCNQINNILLKRFLTKKTLSCRYCSNENIKLPKHKQNKKELTNVEIIDNSNIAFNKESEKFKLKYFTKHLTNIEFNLLKSKIYSVDNVLYKEHIFYEHIKHYNHYKYSQKVLIDNKFITFKKVKFYCDCCGEIFSTSRDYKKKSYTDILCRRCHLNNKVFNIKKMVNINNDIITYQSLLELRLIEYCNNNNILIEDGKIIDYIFNGKKLKYYVDFFIPSKNLLIEIKDDHCWYKKEVETGKWEAKMIGVEIFLKNINYQYSLVFKKDFDNFIYNL